MENSEELIRLINESSEAFRKTPPDFNGCLNKVRVAIQTLVTSIAKARLSQYSASFDLSCYHRLRMDPPPTEMRTH